MARQIYEFAPVVPGGTAKTAPVTVAMMLPERQVESVELLVPPGPSGLMGFALAVGGQQVIPYNMGQYIVTDDEQRTWPLDGYPTTGRWSLIGYNTDVWDHTVYVRFLVALVVDNASIIPPTPISAVDLTTLGNVATGGA